MTRCDSNQQPRIVAVLEYARRRSKVGVEPKPIDQFQENQAVSYELKKTSIAQKTVDVGTVSAIRQ